jgi:hypothetical protein
VAAFFIANIIQASSKRNRGLNSATTGCPTCQASAAMQDEKNNNKCHFKHLAKTTKKHQNSNFALRKSTSIIRPLKAVAMAAAFAFYAINLQTLNKSS